MQGEKRSWRFLAWKRMWFDFVMLIIVVGVLLGRSLIVLAQINHQIGITLQNDDREELIQAFDKLLYEDSNQHIEVGIKSCLSRTCSCLESIVRENLLGKEIDCNDFIQNPSKVDYFRSRQNCEDFKKEYRNDEHIYINCEIGEQDFYAYRLFENCLNQYYIEGGEFQVSQVNKLLEKINFFIHNTSQNGNLDFKSYVESKLSGTAVLGMKQTVSPLLAEPFPSEPKGTLTLESTENSTPARTETSMLIPTATSTIISTETSTPTPTETTPPTSTKTEISTSSPIPFFPTIVPTTSSGGGDGNSLDGFLILGAIIVAGAAVWLFVKGRKKRSSRSARRRSAVTESKSSPPERRTLRLEDDFGFDPKTMEIGSMRSFLNFSFGNMQHQGRRDYQEDSFGFSDISDPELVAKRGILAIVADGMGGLKNGKSISERAIQKFRKSFVKFSPSGDIPQQMLALVAETNHDIYETDKQKGGTTLLCVYIYRNSMHWISVGDSAIFLFRKGRLYQLNKEHNRLNDLYLKFMYREMTKEQLMAEPSLQGLTSNIGRRELRDVDRNLTALKLQSGDRILLCTDGVSGRLTEKELLVAISQANAQSCADAMKRMILTKNAPKQDNFTAEVIFCD